MTLKNQEEMFLIRIISLLILLNIHSVIHSQKVAPRFFFSEKILSEKVDSLELAFSTNKLLYEKFKLPTLVALSYYPELSDTKIYFKRKKISSTMAAIPKGLNVFRRKGKRKYCIKFNDYPSAEIQADSIPFNAQIGVIGHELANIVEYETKSSLAIIAIGLKYWNKKFKRKFEKATDQRTIEHGLGWQCYDFAVFAFQYKNASAKYLKHKKDIYMSPEEIKQGLD